MKKMSLTILIFIGLGAGVAVGFFIQGNTAAIDFIHPVGTIFMNLIKFVIVPIEFCGIVKAIVSVKDAKIIGKMGARSILFFLATTAVAVTIALILATLYKPFFVPMSMENISYTPTHTNSVSDFVTAFFPSNVMQPFLQNNMIQIIVAAILFGFGIIAAKEKGKALYDIIDSLYEVSVKIMQFILKLSPFAVATMIAVTVATNGIAVMSNLLSLIILIYICFILNLLLIYLPLVKGLGRQNPWQFLKKMAPAMLFAFSTASSVATLPLTMRCCKNMGVKRQVYSFVLPLGATINMDGAAIYLGVCSIFLFTCYGIALSVPTLLFIGAVTVLASIGSAGVPGSAIVMMALVLQTVGLPLEGIGILIGIDRIIDMGRNTLNITGDAICALYVSRKFEKEEAACDRVCED